MKSETPKIKRATSSVKKVKPAIAPIVKESQQPNLLVRIIRKLTKSTPASIPVFKKRLPAAKSPKFEKSSLKSKAKNPFTSKKIVPGKLSKKGALVEKIDFGTKQKEIARKKSLDFQKKASENFKKNFNDFIDRSKKNRELTEKRIKETHKIMKDTRVRLRDNSAASFNNFIDRNKKRNGF